MLVLAVVLFGADASWGPNQVALLSGAMIAGVIGLKNGYRWSDIEEGINKGNPDLAGRDPDPAGGRRDDRYLDSRWHRAGDDLLRAGCDRASVYASACLLCALVALSVGSSWTVAGTIGIGLIGIADGLGLSRGDHGGCGDFRGLLR